MDSMDEYFKFCRAPPPKGPECDQVVFRIGPDPCDECNDPATPMRTPHPDQAALLYEGIWLTFQFTLHRDLSLNWFMDRDQSRWSRNLRLPPGSLQHGASRNQVLSSSNDQFGVCLEVAWNGAESEELGSSASKHHWNLLPGSWFFLWNGLRTVPFPTKLLLRSALQSINLFSWISYFFLQNLAPYFHQILKRSILHMYTKTIQIENKSF